MTDPGLPPYVALLERSSRRMISAERSQIHTTVRSGQLQNPRVSSFSRQQVPVLTLEYGKQAPMAITGPQRLGITIMHRWHCSLSIYVLQLYGNVTLGRLRHPACRECDGINVIFELPSQFHSSRHRRNGIATYSYGRRPCIIFSMICGCFAIPEARIQS